MHLGRHYLKRTGRGIVSQHFMLHWRLGTLSPISRINPWSISVTSRMSEIFHLCSHDATNRVNEVEDPRDWLHRRDLPFLFYGSFRIGVRLCDWHRKLDITLLPELPRDNGPLTTSTL